MSTPKKKIVSNFKSTKFFLVLSEYIEKIVIKFPQLPKILMIFLKLRLKKFEKIILIEN